MRIRERWWSWLGLMLACTGCDAVSDAPPGAASSLAPEVDCDGCYIVNAALAGAGTDVFMAGYIGTSEGGFVRRFDGSAWGTVLESEAPDGIRELWATPDGQQIYLIASTGPARLELETRELTELEVAGSVVWGSDADDVFILDEGSAHHFDGDAWQSQALDVGVPRAISGTSASNVFALGEDGELAHFDGQAWTDVPHELRQVEGILALADDQLYAVTGSDQPDDSEPDGSIARFDGESWHVEQEAEGDVLLAIAAASADEVYAVGATRTDDAAVPIVWHWGGEVWQRHRVAGSDAFLWDAYCVPDDTCYAAGTDNAFIDLGALVASH